MNQPRKVALPKIGLSLMAAVITATAAFSPIARGDNATPAQPTKIATVDLGKAYLALAETKTMADQVKGMDGELKTMSASHQAQLQDMQTQLQHIKGQPHEDMMAQFDQKSLQFKMDETAMQARMARQSNRQLVHAFMQIQTAVEGIAKKRGLDLVMVAANPDLVDNLGDVANAEAVRNNIFNRNVLYVSPNVDITSDVIAAVDLAEKSAAAPAGH